MHFEGVASRLTCTYYTGWMLVKGGAGRRDSGGQRGQTPGAVDPTEKLFRKYSGGDAQMDAAEFAASLKEILGRRMYAEMRILMRFSHGENFT